MKKLAPDRNKTYYVTDTFELVNGKPTISMFFGNVRFAQWNGESYSYFIRDHLNSASVVVDNEGAVLESAEYLPFGADMPTGSITRTDYTITDQEKDRSTGFYNYDARHYGPNASRFISPDSLLPNPYDPQQLNRYAYARNNPLKYVDPSGHFSKSAHKEMAYNAAIDAGWSEAAAKELAKECAAADADPGAFDTKAEHTNRHGMAGEIDEGKYQDRDTALKATATYAERMLESGSFYGIGRGLHAIQDTFSAQHAGREWHGLTSFSGLIEALVHGIAELFASQESKDKAYQATTNALKDMPMPDAPQADEDRKDFEPNGGFMDLNTTRND